MKTKQRLHIYVSNIFAGLIFFLLNSCQPTPTPSPTPTLIDPSSTMTPSATSTMTSTPCPFVTPIPPPTATQTTLIYVLIDRSGSYGAYTQLALETVIKSLTLAVDPGDSIYLVWLGENEDPNNYLWSGKLPYIPAPIFISPVPTYTLMPTLTVTPIASITPSPTHLIDSPETKTILQEQQELQAATVKAETATSVAATATQAVIENLQAHAATATHEFIIIEQGLHEQKCLQFYANAENQQSLASYEESRELARQDFIMKTLTPLLTPTISASDGETRIYDGLFYASRVIQTERGHNAYSSYYLLIFSDMVDAGSLEGKGLEVNLEGVNVLVAMMYCDEAAIRCQARETNWRDYLESKNAILPPYAFKLIGETTPDLIADFLNR